MKKVLSIILSLILVLGFCSVPAAASTDVRVTLNGEFLTFDVPAQIINDRTMVPMRGIFEALGATVTWNADTYTATGVLGDITINITIGEAALYRNGQAVTLDVPAQIVDNRTLVPLRAIAQSFDCVVGWDAANYIAMIETTKEETPFEVLKNFIVESGEYDAESLSYDMFHDMEDYSAMWSYYTDSNSIDLAIYMPVDQETSVYGSITLADNDQMNDFCTIVDVESVGIQAIGMGKVKPFEIGEGFKASHSEYDVVMGDESVMDMLSEEEIAAIFGPMDDLAMAHLVLNVLTLQAVLETNDLGISVMDFGFVPQVI